MASGRIASARSRIHSLGALLRKSLPTGRVAAGRGGLLERAADLGRVGAWECDLNTNVLTWTNGVFDVFGFPRGTRIRREDTLALYSDESRAELERLRADAIARRHSFSMDAKILRTDGGQRWIRITASVVRCEGRPTHLYGMKQDVTQELEYLELLRKSAEHDALTGLASRSVFQTRFLDASAAARATFPVSAIVLFDLDGFKLINDENGHCAGDLCLRIIATRLADYFVDAAMIARIGGDEFAVLLSDPPGEHLNQRVAACLSLLSRPFLCNGRLLSVSASAGIASADDQGTHDPDGMFSAADGALYQAKRAGRNRVRLAAA